MIQVFAHVCQLSKNRNGGPITVLKFMSIILLLAFSATESMCLPHQTISFLSSGQQIAQQSPQQPDSVPPSCWPLSEVWLSL